MRRCRLLRPLLDGRYETRNLRIEGLTLNAAKIFQAIQGHWLSASLGVIMQLRIPEILAASNTPIDFLKVGLYHKFQSPACLHLSMIQITAHLF